MTREKHELDPFDVAQSSVPNVLDNSEMVIAKSQQNADVAQAAANWTNIGVEIEVLAHGAPIKDLRTPQDRKDPIATYYAIRDHPEKLSIGIITGPKTGLVALTVYTYEPGLGLHALEKHGFFCSCCDTFIRHEVMHNGQSQARFHTVLFYTGQDQFLENSLDALPGVFVRASGELISLPPEEIEFIPDTGIITRSIYECQDTLAPVGIKTIPHRLYEIIRTAERGKMAVAKDFSSRSGVRAELFTQVNEGGRNNAMTRRVGYLIGQKQLNETDALEALLDINHRCCIPPLGASEVRNVVRSIFKRHLRHGK